METPAVPSLLRPSLVVQVIDQLRDRVADGSWPVGTRIPTEPELVASLGVGRNTVREAVRALVHAGVLETRQGSGTFVRAQSELSGVMRRRLGAAGSRDILEVRRALEVEGARLAARRRTPEDVREVRRALGGRDEAWASGELERFADADAAFHLMMVKASHNPALIDLYADLSDAVRASVRNAASGRPEEYVDHAPLVEAVEVGDVERAVREAGGFLDELLEPS